jgi:hypothetical protein
MAVEPVIPAPVPATEPGAFDQNAFAATLIEQFNTVLNKSINAMDKKLNKLSEHLTPKPVVPPVVDPAAPVVEPPVVGDPAKPETQVIAAFNAKLLGLTRQIEGLTEKNAASEKVAADAVAKQLEAQRVAAFDAAIVDIPFVDAKARATFKRAYLADLVRDEDGAFVVQTPKGPMAYEDYFKAEADSMPTMIERQGHSGAGATGGKKAFTGQKIDVSTMSSAEIAKLPMETQQALMAEALSALDR